MNDSKRDSATGAVAALLVVAYLVYFFSLDLPNSGPFGERISRGLMWQIALGWTELPAPAIEAAKRLTDWTHLPQRIPILGFAALIVAAATSAGALILRLLKIDSFADRTPDSAVSSESSPVPNSNRCEGAERLAFAYGLGISALSLVTLALGLVGWMNRAFVLACLVVLIAMICAATVRRIRRGRAAKRATSRSERYVKSKTGQEVGDTFFSPRFIALAAGGVAILSFASVSTLGAMLPATDFDVREYHLQSPKEFFLAGRIDFVPHNVYANMAFGSEMLSLLSMIVAGDWWWGALVGQVVLATFAPMTALGIFALASRLFSRDAGLLAALVYLTTPWVYRVSIIPYTENALCFFLLAGTLAATCAFQQAGQPAAMRLWCVVGALAGSAAACKYPALVSTVFPLFIAAAGSHWFGRFVPRAAHAADIANRPQLGNSTAITARHVLAFLLGAAVTFGPWLAKNWAVAGDPMYPLLYRVFGGRDWTDAKHAKWEWSHRVSLLVALGSQRPPPGKTAHPDDPQHAITLRVLKENLLDVTAKDDRLSPLLFALAPLALLRRDGRRAAIGLWMFVAYAFAEWWLLTHRLDRFWMPLVPLVATLAGAGAAWSNNRYWNWFLAIVAVPAIFFNFSYCTSSLAGDNRYAAPLIDRTDPLSAPVNWMNQQVPASSRVLAVGAADLFHLDRPAVYNTVFDDSIFEQLVRDKSPEAVARALGERGITHVYVSWSEVQRYRGTYGYAAFVTPGEFTKLTGAGVLRRMPLERSMPLGVVDLDGERVPSAEFYEVVFQSP